MKFFVTTLLMLTVLLSLTGCKYQKKKAFADYADGIQEDVVYWEASQLTFDQIGEDADPRTYVSYLGTIVDYIDMIITNAEKRNMQIYDPDLKAIDDYYIKYAKDLRTSYALMREAINENDPAKFDKGLKYGDFAIENFQIYVTGIKEYMEANGIKATEDMTEIFNQYQAGE